MNKTPLTSKKAIKARIAQIDSLLATTNPTSPLFATLTTERNKLIFRLSL